MVESGLGPDHSSEPVRLTDGPDVLLRRRLEALGLTGVRTLEFHTNRTVMLTLSNGTLRLHRGYAMAPDRVLSAIVRFLRPRIPRRIRQALQHQFLSFPVDLHAPSRRRSPRKERPRPGDLRIIHQLALAHERLNLSHFDGRLSQISFRISSRMKTRLGEFSVNMRTGESVAITISRAHIRMDSWQEVEHTVLHEMVHQWQAEAGLPLDHGPAFRRKAREVGIEPRARRSVDRERSA
jgi:hypothetical protein